MKTILYSPGDPAGIGTDLFLELVNNKFFDTLQTRIVCLADPHLLQARASMLGFDNDFQNFKYQKAVAIFELPRILIQEKKLDYF